MGDRQEERKEALREGWLLAVDSVLAEGFFAILSVMPSGAISSVGWTGIVTGSGLTFLD